MAYIGLPPKANFTSGLLDRFTSTTGTTVTLTHDISSENDIVVFVNFVKQDSTTYSVGGTGNKTLTLGGTLVSSDIVEVHYLNIVGQTVNPSANSVGSSQLTADSITGQTAETSIADDDTIIIHDTSASALRKMTKANFTSGIGGANTPSFEAKITTEQNPTGATNVKINFDNEIFDTASAYSTTDKRFTVPSGQAGKYFIYSSTNIGSSTNSGFNTGDLKIYKNGSDQNARGHFNTNNDGNGRYYQFSIFNIFDLSVGDYIEIYCYVNASGTVEVRTAESRFGGFKIIE